MRNSIDVLLKERIYFWIAVLKCHYGPANPHPQIILRAMFIYSTLATAGQYVSSN